MEKEEFNRKLGAYIRKKRLEKKWTQEMLADKMGNNFQNISRIERGELSPTLFWCSKLAKIIEIDLFDFIKEAFT
ncbi:MAG: helix-turn-helix transcriptional regulator [Bacteroidales bacterium]|jgi:ribosome-binding protein aMBF1 (putative translation factor)|nr:helix-turn-helix transcriptional regulator [Bacteroidales bacterium]